MGLCPHEPLAIGSKSPSRSRATQGHRQTLLRYLKCGSKKIPRKEWPWGRALCDFVKGEPLGPPASCPSLPFWLGGQAPTNIDYRRKLVFPYSNLTGGGQRSAVSFWFSRERASSRPLQPQNRTSKPTTSQVPFPEKKRTQTDSLALFLVANMSFTSHCRPVDLFLSPSFVPFLVKLCSFVLPVFLRGGNEVLHHLPWLNYKQLLSHAPLKVPQVPIVLPAQSHIFNARDCLSK